MNKSFILITTSFLLTACGGSGSDKSSSGSSDPAELSGSFIDSPVKGLFYETESRSGLTNTNGEFKYLEGETITFSIGGITLGQATASELITPFTLSGIAPLTKEAEITARLSSEQFNSFDRAINISTLLQALDKDGLPNNGIDLGNANRILADETINLYVKARTFETQSQFSNIRRAMNVGHRVNFIDAAEHLYDSLGLQVESAKVSAFVSEINNQVFESVRYEYDDNGNIKTQFTDTDNDGVTDITKSFQYDDNGNLIEITNSATQITETLTYDINNNITRRIIDKPDTEEDQQENYTYLSNRLIRFELDTESDGLPNSVTQYQYDTSGNLTAYQIDKNGDGENDANAEYTFVDNQVTSFVEDKNNDGLPDLVIAYQYDENGNRSSHNIDVNLDGEADSFGSFTYDANNNITRYELDRDLDGTPDYIEDYNYDQNNNRTQYRRDLDADGTWDSIAIYTYDINGNRIRMIEDSDANGLVDKIWEGNYEAAILENSWESIGQQL